jgi:hypothetical protein
VNLGQLSAFQAGETVSLETLKEKRMLNPSGSDAKLPLKVTIFSHLFRDALPSPSSHCCETRHPCTVVHTLSRAAGI